MGRSRPFCATTFTTARAFRRRRVGGRAKEDVAPGVVVFASRFWDSDSGRQRRATTRSPMPDADEEEGSVLDLPEEYVRAVPSRRPDIFPDLKEIKQPMPNPLPGDPEMPDEEEEEKERKENPGEPGGRRRRRRKRRKNFEERKEETREGGRERGVKRKTEEARRGVILSSSRYVVTRYARTLITLYYDV